MPIVNTDLHAVRREYLFEPPCKAWFLSRIRDSRDAPLLFMLCNAAALTLPGAALVYACESHAVGLVYCATKAILLQQRFILGLHFCAHRGLFWRRELDAAVLLVLCPFFGIVSGMYHLHHVVMHHTENNLRMSDLSSTEQYQRDSVLHFLQYWLRFLIGIWFELPIYAIRRRRFALAGSTLAAELLFGITVSSLYAIRPVATIWVFIAPLLLNSFALMLGNWSQHIFVDPANPRCNYHMTYNVINSAANQLSFNDGYHIEHHLQSRKHWSELPESFMSKLDRYAQEDAIIFDGLDPILVGVLTFAQRYDLLGAHFVQHASSRSPSEIEAFLRARLRPITKQ